jgi:hypothetical protein
MSNYEYSSYRVDTERQERLRILGDINDIRNNINGILSKVRLILDNASDGIKQTFNSEVSSALRWLSEAEVGTTEKSNMTTSLPDISSSLAILKSIAERGKDNMNLLIRCFTVKAGEMEKQGTARLSQIDSTYLGQKELIDKWFGQDVIGECEQSLNDAEQLLKDRRLGELGDSLDRLESMLLAKTGEAKELEEKQQRRLYVLASLRKVCTDLKFEEIDVPNYEIESNKRSRITYSVDTLDQGKIQFYLSLDDITANSRIPQNKCMSEFNKLSKYLEEEFGIKTSFKNPERNPDEKIQKSAKDLPDENSHMEMTS